MKKSVKLITATLLAAICALALIGCSQPKAPAASGNAPAGSGNDSGEKAVLTMATEATFPPYEFKEGDSFAGIDIDIAHAIADKLGMELQINDVAFDSIIAGVSTGKYDLGLAGLTVTDERKQSVNFSDSYAKGVQAIIVKEGSPIKSPDDLANANLIGVQISTTGDIYCADDFGEEHVKEYATGVDAVQDLIKGVVDCVVIDKEPANQYVSMNEGLTVLDTAYTEEDYAIAINKDNTDLLDTVNEVLKELKADGTLDEIVAKYIK